MKTVRSLISGLVVTGLTLGLVPVLGGCGGETAAVDDPSKIEAKAKADKETADAFKDYQKSQKSKKRR